MKYILAGKEKLISQLQSIPESMDTTVGAALKEVGDTARDNIRAAIPTGGGEPSAPGAAPHSQTGKLRRSIFSKLSPKILGHEILLNVGIASNAFYGFILEYGANSYAKGFKRSHEKGSAKNKASATGTRILPRPFFWSALEQFWHTAPVEVEKAVQKVLRKYA